MNVISSWWTLLVSTVLGAVVATVLWLVWLLVVLGGSGELLWPGIGAVVGLGVGFAAVRWR